MSDIQPSQQAPGRFDTILGAIVAGVETYRHEAEEKYNDAVFASDTGIGSNMQSLLVLGLVVVGLYLVLES